jgi:hypothetical protein
LTIKVVSGFIRAYIVLLCIRAYTRISKNRTRVTQSSYALRPIRIRENMIRRNTRSSTATIFTDYIFTDSERIWIERST